jgi:hypothetical protein
MERDAQVEDVRVESRVFQGGVRIGNVREPIPDDVRPAVAASNPQACARASQKIQRSSARVWERAGERDAATIALCKRGDRRTELKGESQSHGRKAGPEIGPVSVWKQDERGVGV